MFSDLEQFYLKAGSVMTSAHLHNEWSIQAIAM